ncbi:TPM domain-containing protein, partial [Streptomyces sp. NPDC058953]|uniref:TPM domain-containing protein n=1 Tax=Streptomyces sp. NPDC058953 TaxID=3346676 RepID=UPI003679DCD6
RTAPNPLGVDGLDGPRDDVVRQVDRNYADQRLQLFVVYVRDFSGRTAQEWADATARRNGLGTDDVLLAVATHDRQFAYWAPATSRLTDAQLADVARTAVVPPLRQNDWAGAAVGAADGYAATLSGRAVPTPAITPGDPDPGAGTATGTGAADLVIPVGVAVAVVGTAAYAAVRRRRRTATPTTPQGGRAGWSSGPESAPGESTAGLRGRIARAETVAADVRREMEGRYDPIDALRRLEEADAALDEALTGARVDEEEARRARTLLGQATLGARAAVGAAADYIATHRGAVGSRARTRLAEAQRRLELSERLATGAAGPAEEEAGEGEASPAVSGADGNGGTVTGGEGRRNARAALAEAQRADALAREAQRLAEEDVRGFGNPFGPGGASQAGSAGGGLGGAVLGGIVLGGLFGGGGRRGSGGGGFGGFGSGSGYGGFGGGFEGRPGSFGGGGTRGRMGGGRF